MQYVSRLQHHNTCMTLRGVLSQIEFKFSTRFSCGQPIEILRVLLSEAMFFRATNCPIVAEAFSKNVQLVLIH